MAATRRYLLPPISKTARPFGRISALRNIALTSVGFAQSAALTIDTHARNATSASCRPGFCQNSRKVLTAIIRMQQYIPIPYREQMFPLPIWDRNILLHADYRSQHLAG